MTTTRRQRGLPVPPGRPRTEVAIMASHSLLAIAAWLGCLNGLPHLGLPQWAATTAAVLLGGCLGLLLFIIWIIEAPRRLSHARRWRTDPAYRKQWGQGL